MIHSILDNDLYKFTMQQAVLHNFPNVEVEYDLAIRSKNIDLRPFRNEIEKEINRLAELMLTKNEYNFLNTIRFLSKDYINWLRNFRYEPCKHIHIYEKNNNLAITIKGSWLNTILYEVPILAIISEIYHSRDGNCNLGECTRRLEKKIKLINSMNDGFVISEFGTRRRNSYMIQDHVLNMMVNQIPKHLAGTSNVHFAKKYGIKAIGTIAHEMIMCSQILFPISSHQQDIMDLWSKEYNGDLGIMLSDTIGTKQFFKDFQLRFAKLFDGVRHDSGDPYQFGADTINHYKKLNIDSKTKKIIFSDNLDIVKAINLYNHFHNSIKPSFGIGTHLSNDCGDPAISIVIKIQLCNGFPVAKLSDDAGKAMSRDKNYLEYLKKMYC